MTSTQLVGATPGYPLPAPGSFLVMATGALAVLGRVWTMRREGKSE